MPSKEDRWTDTGRSSLVDRDEDAEMAPSRRAIWNFGWAYVFPWVSPIIVHAINDGHELAELAAMLAWPMIFLFVGMYIGTLRGAAILRHAEPARINEIASQLRWYANWHNVGIVFLALFESGAAICLSAAALPEAAIVYVVLTALLYAPFCLLTWQADCRLQRAQWLSCEA